jgi:hypothetical protein
VPRIRWRYRILDDPVRPTPDIADKHKRLRSLDLRVGVYVCMYVCVCVWVRAHPLSQQSSILSLLVPSFLSVYMSRIYKCLFEKVNLFYAFWFLVCFLCFVKFKADMQSISCAAVSAYRLISFGMPEPVFTKHVMYIMAREPISVAYFINPFHLCIPHIVAKQLLGINVPAATNTRKKVERFYMSFTMWSVSYQRNTWLVLRMTSSVCTVICPCRLRVLNIQLSECGFSTDM